MSSFSKNSLELLRSRIDLIEVVSPYLKLQRSGASYKALCPFHDEKTPSLIIQKGDSHYHCFGCGAHGDAIQFLMTHLKMNFVEAVENLAERFHVQLEEGKNEQKSKSTPKILLKELLDKANQFYRFILLHTLEGHVALDYLYNRGIDLSFIEMFGLGFSPRNGSLLIQFMAEHKYPLPLLEEAGLISKGKDFFSDRTTLMLASFPARSPSNAMYTCLTPN